MRDRIGLIIAPSEAWRKKAHSRLDQLTKPLGSLGRLEALAAQMVAIRQQELSEGLRKAVYVFAADHGVTVEGISAYPRAVTKQMVLNFLGGGAAINVLARQNSASLHVVDVGVDADFECAPRLIHRKVANGSRNMLREPAMNGEELLQAMDTGEQLARDAAASGHSVIAVGEMGIGNTTAASVITCALTGATASRATGRGTGLGPEQHAHKVDVVERILKLHFSTMQQDPVVILQRAGGLEIAAMVGMILGAARERLVVVIDGFISTAAAAIAFAIEPAVRGYLIAGHQSEEPGHAALLEYLSLQPVLTLGMRLGEGSGAVLTMAILDAAIVLYTQMATFSSAGVSEATA